MFKHSSSVLSLPLSFTHLPQKASPHLPLQAFVDHELDGGVQHEQQRREGPVPQSSHALTADDLSK